MYVPDSPDDDSVKWRGVAQRLWLEAPPNCFGASKGAIGLSKVSYQMRPEAQNRITCFTTRLRTPLTCAPASTKTRLRTKTVMATQPEPITSQKEGRLLLALQALQSSSISSV